MIASVRSVNHHVVTRDDGHMVDAGSVIEKHQIARLVLRIGHVFALAVVLHSTHTGDLLACALVHRVLRQARAVKTHRVSTLFDAQRFPLPSATYHEMLLFFGYEIDYLVKIHRLCKLVI